MFSKNSRYRKLPDEVTLDVKGRQLLSKSLRLLPKVTGTFQHTIEESDRLDHLAYKYYKQPRKWWRLCDANPEFLWPQALLGKDPFLTQQFPVTYSGPESQPPRALLLNRLTALVGVENAWLDDGEQSDASLLGMGDIKDTLSLITKLRGDSNQSTKLVSQFIWAEFDQTTKQLLADPNLTSPQGQSALVQALNKILQGNSFYEPTRFTGVSLRPETQSLITQGPTGERLIRLNRLLLEDAYPLEIARNQQSIIVIYNRLNTQADKLAYEIEQAGFTVEHPQTIGRQGKPIVIPPDAVG